MIKKAYAHFISFCLTRRQQNYKLFRFILCTLACITCAEDKRQK